MCRSKKTYRWEEAKMRQKKRNQRNLKTAVWTMVLVGAMTIFGSGISAEAADYGTQKDTGNCVATGSDVTWTVYDGDGDGTGETLVIAGSGDIKDWGSSADWKTTYGNSITTVVFEEGSQITRIGNNAFYDHINLKDITLPNTITSIGYAAFQQCKSLTNINIPSGVTEINSLAFAECTNISSITIPATTTNIGERVFADCKNISINVEAANENYSSKDGILYNKEKTYLIVGTGAKGNIILPDEVRTIGNNAFNGCDELESVTFPEGLTTIEMVAFKGCSALRNIILPKELETIGHSVFEGCSALTSINIPSKVTHIDYNAFKGCSNLTSVNIPFGVTCIETGTFASCVSLKSIIIPPYVNTIRAPEDREDPAAFDGCDNLEEIFYPGILSLRDAGIPNTTTKITYSINTSDVYQRISAKVEVVGSGKTNINLPAKIYGKKISSLNWDNSINKEEINVTCGTHYPKPEDWNYEPGEHSFTECCLCEQEVNVHEEHEYYSGNHLCECNYKPFDITIQPQGQTWVYGTRNEAERTLSVEVTKTLGGENIAYQWYDNGSLIEGATENTYVVREDVHSSDYQCKVSCGGYSIDSSLAEISVT